MNKPNKRVTSQAGDLCILLAPSYSQSPVIRTQLADLQRQFGGEIIAPLHLTCGRFQATEAQLEVLKPQLLTLCKRSTPLHVRGNYLEPFYSTFRAQEILKCHVDLNEELEAFVEEVRTITKTVGIESNYSVAPLLLTLLEGVTLNHLNIFPFRRKLFIGQRLLLARIKSPGRYTTLFSAAFAGVQEAELQVSDLF